MKKIVQKLFNPRERGQSLVEVALFFPIFLIIIAGLVEVSNIVVTQNRVNNATRVGSRFGANGGENQGMALASLNAVTQTLNMDEDLWDVWAIRGRVDDTGNNFVPDTWEFDHAYGISQTEAFSDVVEADIKDQVLEQLQTDENGNSSNPAIAAGLSFVGVYAIHDIDSILGLDALPTFVGLNSVKSLNVMRTTGIEVETSNGCDAFPIAIHEGIRSVLAPGDTSSAQNRWPSTFKHFVTSPAPFPYPDPNYYRFVNHVPNQPLEDAQEGYVYKIENGTGPGQFGWLGWNGCANDSTALEDSLSWPGNSMDYTPLPGSCPAYGSPKVAGFVEMGDPTDRSMHIGDWVATSSGTINSSGARKTLEEHIVLGRQLRMIVYGDANNLGGSNAAYKIKRFAIFKIIGHNLPESWIMAEFIRWDDSCGQPTD
ncbi:MAG: pilus assembly protein [Ardenticatenaceae bacterium]|nr:pilus assembly protein [Anaerolineales bacterium]MCB8985034.1 pilus assembly protein [Ardenticatenaceae bacterium]MCB8986801.1 pilus assembly protein [Ardenticatenaceae bacterium]